MNVPIESLPFERPQRLFGENSRVSKLLIKSVDCHAGGEPARIVFSGVPRLPASCSTAILKRKYMMEELDYITQSL